MPVAELELTPQIRKDLKTLCVFVRIYCDAHHAGEPRTIMQLKSHDVTAISGRELTLCPACQKLLAHAIVKRIHCPMDPKPMCKHCPNHCYRPEYRRQIQEVMRFSGKRLIFSGRIDYLLHLWF